MSHPSASYVVHCSCGKQATFKIAAVWSDGTLCELKTYALCCAQCVRQHYQQAKTRRTCCRLTPGETLEAPWIYELATGCPSGQLCRRTDLETLAEESPP
jgi:hypothetical protein